MQDLLVDEVHVLELAEVDTLRSSHHLDLGRMGQDIVKGNDHAAWDIQELTFHGQDLGGGGQVLLETVRWRSISHERKTHLEDILLPLQDPGNVNRDFGIVFALQSHDGLDASACGAGSRRPLQHWWCVERDASLDALHCEFRGGFQ